MSEHFQSGMHLDADALSAFIEGVLPAHERNACLAHLAACQECREAAFLACEPLHPTAPQPVPPKKRRWWSVPIPAFAAAALACTLVVSIVISQRNSRPTPALPAPSVAIEFASPPAAQPPAEAREEQKQNPLAEARTGARNRIAPRAPTASTPPHPTASASGTTNNYAPASPPPRPERPVSDAATPGPPAASAPAAQTMGAVSGIGGAPRTSPLQAAVPATGAIAGRVTDPTGAVIANANISLRPMNGMAGGSAAGAGNLSAFRPQAGIFGPGTKTDQTGQFEIAGLTPGHYELRINSPGFQQINRPVELKPGEVAKADSILNAGQAAETIQAEAPAASIQVRPSPAKNGIQAESLPLNGRVAGPLAPLAPPAIASVTQGQITLNADSAGRLLFTNNGGKSWKVVKAAWHGKIRNLDTAPDPAKTGSTLFRLTTDSGDAWLSRDGTRWKPAPAAR